MRFNEISDKTLTSYLTKVDADSQKHEKDPTKRSPEKRNKSVAGFSRAFNKLDARKGVAEGDKKPHPQTWHDVDAKLGKQVDRMTQAEKVKKGLAHPDTLKKKGVAEGAPELLKKEMPLHRHAERLLAQNGVGKDDPDYHQHLANTIKHLRKFGNIDLINKQGVAEGSAPSHSELARLAHEAYIAAVSKGNAPMANHYKQEYEKHKRLAASERKRAAKGMAEGTSNIGSAIKSLYQKIYDAGDDEIDYFYHASPIFAQYWDEYEGDLDSIIAEVDPSELEVIQAELESYVDDANLAESAENPYGYEVGQQVELASGQQGQVTDIFDGTIEVLLPDGRTAVVDFQDATVVDEGIKGEIAGGALGTLVGGAAGSVLGPVGGAIGSALGGSAGAAIGTRWEDGKPLKEKQQLDEMIPLLAAGARLFMAAAPKIAQVIGRAGQASARGAGQVAKSGAEIAAKNAGQIGLGTAAYEIGSSIPDIVKDITAKVGTAVDEKTILELATIAFKYAIPAGIVLAILYGGKKAIDSIFNDSSDKKAVAETKPKEQEADYGPDYQDMVARVKKLAGLGPLKTVYDPQKRVYKNVPVAVQPAQQPKKER